MQRIILIFAIILAVECPNVSQLYAQEASKVFKSRHPSTCRATMNLDVYKSDTIDLSRFINTNLPIYSLSVDATIYQPREASFVRIVLEDIEGNNWLVLECDNFKTDTSVVKLSEFCQETALLFGIIPSRLRCHVTGGAHLHLHGIHIATECTENENNYTIEKKHEMVSKLCIEQTRIITERINLYNEKHHKLWRAGLTDRSKHLYSHKQTLNEGDAYTENVKYYSGGIYEMGEFSPVNDRSSTFVESFDWRDRHNINWNTCPKNQGNTENCTAFAVVGMIEALTNLYFNNKMDINLSEQDLLDYIPQGVRHNTRPKMQYAVNYGVIDENTIPYQGVDNQVFTGNRPYGNENVKISGFCELNPEDIPEDTIKKNLIKYGPAVSGYYYRKNNGSLGGHAMTLIGYDKTQCGGQYMYINSNGYTSTMTIPANSPNVGKTYWIFKNSDYCQLVDTCLYILFNDYYYMDTVYVAQGPITRRGHYDTEINITDRDYDGYFFWGIGPRPNNRLPSWAFQDADGDDSDDATGKMNEYGRTYDTIHDGILVSGITTISNDRFLRGGISFNSNNILYL